MDFGTFNLMGYRTSGASTAQILQEAVEQTRLADEGGFGIAWFAEHHFSNYCVCPSPLMMASYCAPLTQRIKLGAGVLVLPLYSPVRVAAEIGMVDSLSQGRLVIGVGSGYQPFEFERFGLDLADSKAMFSEALSIIEQGLTEEFVAFRGKHFDLPKTHISARPYGKLPEIWLAGDSAPLRTLAAEKGYPIMTNGRLADAVTVGRRRADYEAPFVEAGKDPSALKWGLLRFCCVTDSKADALEYAENARWQLRLASALRRREEILDGHMLVGTQPLPNEPSLEDIVASQMIGDVDTCIERGIAEIRNSRPAHVSLYFQVGNYDHKRAMRSMELFITKVVPGIEREVGPLSEIGR